MKCPNPTHKKKPVDLQTIRTLANSDYVKRERRCPACKKKYWTTEEFESNIQLKTRESRKEYEEIENKFFTAEHQRKETNSILKEFSLLLKKISQ